MSVLRMLAVPSVAIALGLFLLPGCGEDNPADSGGSDPSDLTGDWPAPPRPSAPTDQVPDISTVKFDSKGKLDHFQLRTAESIDEECIYCNEILGVIKDASAYLEEICDKYSSGIPVFPWTALDSSVQLVDDGEILEFQWPFISCSQMRMERMCEPLGEFGGHYYYLSTREQNFLYALANAALAPDAGLVNIETPEENSFLMSVLDCAKAPFIIGHARCYPTSSWFWYWGEDHAWNNYRNGEPGEDDLFALMSSGGCDGKWVGVSSLGRDYYVLESTEPLPDVQCSFYHHSATHHINEGRYFWPGQTKITTEPYLGRELYWIKIGEAILTSENQEFRQTLEFTRGASETHTKGFATMIGASTTVEVGGSYEGLSASVSATLYGEETTSEEHSVKIYRETRESKEFSSGGPTEGGSRVVVVWQRAERYTFIDAEGEPWEDPVIAMLLTPSFEHRLESFLIDATDFN